MAKHLVYTKVFQFVKTNSIFSAIIQNVMQKSMINMRKKNGLKDNGWKCQGSFDQWFTVCLSY